MTVDLKSGRRFNDYFVGSLNRLSFRLKKILVIVLLLSAYKKGQSQGDSASIHTREINQFKRELASATTDSVRIFCLQRLNFHYETENPDSSLKYGMEALALSRKTRNLQAEASTLNGLSGVLLQQGRIAEALEYLFEGRKLAESIYYTHEVARSFRRTGMLYSDLKDFSKARDFDVQALMLDKTIPKNTGSIMVDYMNLADVYQSLNKLDSTLYFSKLALENRAVNESLIHTIFLTLGDMYVRKNMTDSALFFYQEAREQALKYSDFHDAADASIKIASIYEKIPQRDSALHYALTAYQFGQRVSYKKSILDATALLADLYDSTDARKALKYFRISNAAKDSLFGTDNIQVIQNMISREEKRREEEENARVAYTNRIRLYALMSGALLLLIISWLLYRNNKQKQKTNIQLQVQKDELQSALQQLKTTQAQLIMSEKMASLGELTAGIAHEIQNPLNFVNNFSDLNTELVADAESEIDKGNIGEAKTILNDIKENEQKINHHGKRADAIVKGMLQHSRTSSGSKEPTDINALADEYLRLAYMGFRTKEKSFNANLNTDYDSSIGSLNIVSQDIGRVLLNIYNNAFYAIMQKKSIQPEEYLPILSVKTKKKGNDILISIMDNGSGIPQKIKEKIFQPFFTSKPAGQGTGLGLSLSYDIVKAHGGDITVNSKEGEFTEFLIQIPVV